MKNIYTDKTLKELDEALAEKREEVRTLRFGTATTRDKHSRRKARRAVAQILTLKKQKA